ncbi:MAG: hypothetical protein MSA09_06525, partial [Lachnospiraceae bacterium]|nr:hypothetical protein [Lachnospiraceae bacterium]
GRYMSDEKWNRFALTGSVRDYLEYRACARETCEKAGCVVREERKDGADHPVERNGALCNANRRL